MSALVVCLICDRQHVMFWPHGVLVCSNCGVDGPQIIKENVRKALSIDWEDKGGLPRIDAQRRTLAGLKWLRDNKGYKPKWADARYRAIFGDWPPREFEGISPEPPTIGLMRRVHLDNEDWKRQKRKEERANKPVIAIIPHDPVQPSYMTEDDWAVKL